MRPLGGLTRSPAAGAAASRPDSSRGDAARAQFGAEVRDHLTRQPRQLPTRYLYDDLGSALFEAICRLPWYRITRAEERLLATEREDIARLLGPVATVVELGSGSGLKLRRLLSAPALAARPISAHLVDLSCSALEMATQTLASLAHVRVTTHEAEYRSGLADATRAPDSEGRTVVLFFGSNIGNFDPPDARAFLREIRAALRPGDALLLGADLVKPERELVLAYDDPLGITAAFDLNLLVRINRELGADFDLQRWAHRAVWNAAASRMEMHLVALETQRVRVPGAELEIDVREGETIWTESSYKYTPADLDALLEAGGFRVGARWTDRVDGFALTLGEVP